MSIQQCLEFCNLYQMNRLILSSTGKIKQIRNNGAQQMKRKHRKFEMVGKTNKDTKKSITPNKRKKVELPSQNRKVHRPENNVDDLLSHLAFHHTSENTPSSPPVNPFHLIQSKIVEKVEYPSIFYPMTPQVKYEIPRKEETISRNLDWNQLLQTSTSQKNPKENERKVLQRMSKSPRSVSPRAERPFYNPKTVTKSKLDLEERTERKPSELISKFFQEIDGRKKPDQQIKSIESQTVKKNEQKQYRQQKKTSSHTSQTEKQSDEEEVVLSSEVRDHLTFLSQRKNPYQPIVIDIKK